MQAGQGPVPDRVLQHASLYLSRAAIPPSASRRSPGSNSVESTTIVACILSADSTSSHNLFIPESGCRQAALHPRHRTRSLTPPVVSRRQPPRPGKSGRSTSSISFTSRESWMSPISFSSVPAPITSCTAPCPILGLNHNCRPAGALFLFLAYLTKSSLTKPGPAMISGPEISAIILSTASKKPVRVSVSPPLPLPAVMVTALSGPYGPEPGERPLPLRWSGCGSRQRPMILLPGKSVRDQSAATGG